MKEATEKLELRLKERTSEAEVLAERLQDTDEELEKVRKEALARANEFQARDLASKKKLDDLTKKHDSTLDKLKLLEESLTSQSQNATSLQNNGELLGRATQLEEELRQKDERMKQMRVQ